MLHRTADIQGPGTCHTDVLAVGLDIVICALIWSLKFVIFHELKPNLISVAIAVIITYRKHN